MRQSFIRPTMGFALATLALALSGCLGNTRPSDAWPFPVPPSASEPGAGNGQTYPAAPAPSPEGQLPAPGSTPAPHPLPLPVPIPTPDSPPPAVQNFPRSIEAGGAKPPVVALVKQARLAKGGKRYDEAEATLERALRIDPRNAWVWRELASLHLAMGRNEQALAESKKCNSLARRNPWIEIESYRVMAASAAALGDNAAATQAQIRYEDRQRWLTTPPLASPANNSK